MPVYKFGDMMVDPARYPWGYEVPVFGERALNIDKSLLVASFPSSNSRSAFVWTALGEFTNVEVEACVAVAVTGRAAVIINAAGETEAESGIVFQVRQLSGELDISRYDAGSFSSIASDGAPDIVRNRPYKLRVVRDDSQLPSANLFFKAWPFWEEEPENWSLTATYSDISGGYVGLFGFDADSVCVYEYIKVNGTHVLDFTEESTLPSGWDVQFGDASWAVNNNYGHHSAGFFRGDDSIVIDGITEFNAEEIPALSFSPTDHGRYFYLLHPQGGKVSFCSIKARVWSSSTVNNQNRLFLRLQSPENDDGYFTELYDGDTFRLGKYTGGTFFVVKSVDFAWSANTRYWVEFEARGDLLRAKIWEDGELEPEGWMIEEKDDEFSVGYRGVGYFNMNGTKNFDSITIAGRA